tara:strand:+ start:4978 stop:6885 length:1908 start_codon:yes stop_codon:yes gene_type:complete
MTLQLLQFSPGIVKDITEYSAGKNGPYWVDGNNVRFKNGYATKIGGWVKDEIYGLTAADEVDYSEGSEVTLIGVARNMNFWRSLSDGEDYLAIGTHNHLFILENEALFDITPLRATATNINNNPFATVDGSTTVTVTDTAHGASDGDYVRFKQATTTNGITADTLNRYYGYQLTLVDANTYTIVVPSAATGTGSGGGSGVDAEYLIGNAGGLGTQTAVAALGWGAGGWGESTWGTPRSGTSSSVVLENSQWSLTLWGEDLIALVRNGALYYWDTSTGTGSRAVLVSSLGGASNVPDESRVAIVSFPDRHLVCGGTTPLGGSDIDPMLVRWSDQEDFKNWTPSATNTAGDQRLEVGTKIVGMISTRDETFISTDEAVYGMNFVGPPFTFAFRLVGTNCGAIGKNTLMNVDGNVYWMGKNNFFMYNGSVNEMACPLRHFVFDRMQKDFADKNFAAHNKEFNEVSWFYVSNANTNTDGNPEPDSFVTYNYEINAWSIGTLDRTCWFDSFGFRKRPFAFSPDGELYNHEEGTDADGAALSAYIETSPLEVSGAGDSLMLVDKIVPDLTMSGTLNVTVESKKYPNASAVTKGPFTISPNSTKVSMRARGRQMSFKLESNAVGDDWSLGDFRVNARQDGLR